MNGKARRAFVGVASNVAQQRHFPAAMRALARQFGELSCSRTYCSADILEAAGAYWNAVVAFETVLDWSRLQAQLKTIEDQAGRDRGERGGTQVTLDLDLILLSEDEKLTHRWALDGATLRASPHVLVPLAELIPHWCYAAGGETLETWARTQTDRARLRVIEESEPGIEAPPPKTLTSESLN